MLLNYLHNRQYHAHPYGEINMSIQVPGTGPNPQLEGLAGFWAGVS